MLFGAVMICESTKYKLADYPVLAKLANEKTLAKKLDARACRYIYASGKFNKNDLSPEEHIFYDSLTNGIIK